MSTQFTIPISDFATATIQEDRHTVCHPEGVESWIEYSVVSIDFKCGFSLSYQNTSLSLINFVNRWAAGNSPF